MYTFIQRDKYKATDSISTMRLKHIPSDDPCAIYKINIHVIDAGYQIDVRPYNNFLIATEERS